MEKSTWETAKMSFWQVYIPLSILLLGAIGAKLIGPHGGLQVDKQAIERESRYVEWLTLKIYSLFL